MKKLLFTLLLCPVLSIAQNNLPGFLNDTLTTSGGYKIYKGQVLQFSPWSVSHRPERTTAKYICSAAVANSIFLPPINCRPRLKPCQAVYSPGKMYAEPNNTMTQRLFSFWSVSFKI